MQRNWMLDNLVEPGDWCAMLDDNISAFTAVKEEVYMNENLGELYPEHFKKNNVAFKNEFYEQEIGAKRLALIFDELKTKAEEICTGFAGFSQSKNYYFSRSRKWKYIQLICSKACIIKNDGIRYDENVRTIDDYEIACQKMAKYGHVLVNAYVWPDSKHNCAGGLGKMSERGNKRVEDCAYLMEKWPGLLKYKERKNSVPWGEIQLRGFGYKFYNKWREEWMRSNSTSSVTTDI